MAAMETPTASAKGTEQQQHVETSAYERERSDRQETPETTERDGANGRIRGTLAAGAKAAPEESIHALLWVRSALLQILKQR